VGKKGKVKMTKQLYPIVVGLKRSPRRMSEGQIKKMLNAFAAESGLKINWKKGRRK